MPNAMLSGYEPSGCQAYRPLYAVGYRKPCGQWGESRGAGEGLERTRADREFYAKRAAGIACYIKLVGWLVRGEYVSVDDFNAGRLPSNCQETSHGGILAKLAYSQGVAYNG